MGRPRKSPIPAEGAQDGMPDAAPEDAPDEGESVMDDIDALLVMHPHGTVHGALMAIHSAVGDAKRRADSVSEHLHGDAFASILERIRAL